LRQNNMCFITLILIDFFFYQMYEIVLIKSDTKLETSKSDIQACIYKQAKEHAPLIK
jgi:hypothetical protein